MNPEVSARSIEEAIRQHRTDPRPRARLLASGRCLAPAAVDPDLVYITTHWARAWEP